MSSAQSSLRTRLFVAVLAWTVLGTSAIWLSASRVFATHVEEHFVNELSVHIQELDRLTHIDANGHPELIRPLSDPRFEIPLSGYYWQVTVAGAPPLRSASMTRGNLDPSIAGARSIRTAKGRSPTGPAILYGMAQRDPSGAELHLVISTDQSELDHQIDEFTRELTLWLALLAAGLLIAGVAMARLTLRPLGRLGKAISRLHQGKANELEGAYPSEIEPLVTDLNAFVRNNAETVARARVQAGNLAHSLRTPLAVIMDEAERLAKNDAARGSAQVLLDQARTMQLQIDYQLAHARSASGTRLPGVTVDVADTLPPILQAIGRLYPDKSFRFENRLSAPAIVRADRIDLLELLSILLDNAGKWARSSIKVTLDGAADGVLVTIADDGPGLSAEQILQAFEVGVRFDEAKPGSGLGLAIARNICEGLGGKLSLHSGGGAEQGLVVRLELPRGSGGAHQ